MRCPNCNSTEKNKVCNTRINIDQTIVRRRRECSVCSHRWTTYEMDASEVKNLSEDINNDSMSRFLDD